MKCLKCGGVMLKDNGDLSCINCGARTPGKPQKRSEWHNHWESNKDAILQSYYSMKLYAFFKKWGLNSCTWQRLKKRWKVKNKLELVSEMWSLRG